jgi:hypothetical protein
MGAIWKDIGANNANLQSVRAELGSLAADFGTKLGNESLSVRTALDDQVHAIRVQGRRYKMIAVLILLVGGGLATSATWLLYRRQRTLERMLLGKSGM